MSAGVDDLTPYERARLERIRTNEAKLRELGLMESPLRGPAPFADLPTRKKRRQSEPPRAEPTRTSARVRARHGDASLAAAPVESPQMDSPKTEATDTDYSRLPIDPDRLDDHEFLVFATLRKHRLLRARQLDIEPYKIAQNRTLCEMVRRRRNDANWATGCVEAKCTSDLLECWGIGPAKAAADGFGVELAAVLDGEESASSLERSRHAA